jgi:hypothetical protein
MASWLDAHGAAACDAVTVTVAVGDALGGRVWWWVGVGDALAVTLGTVWLTLGSVTAPPDEPELQPAISRTAPTPSATEEDLTNPTL